MGMSMEEIRNEVAQLMNHPAYKSVRPMLEHLQSIASAQQPTPPEVVEGLLRAVKGVRQDAELPGQSARNIVNRAASGFVQDNWNVDEVVNVNGDYFKQVYMWFFEQNADKVEETHIEVNIVPVVMTALEVKELISGKIFDEYGDPIYKEEFNALLKQLKDWDVDDWDRRYGAKPEDWKPFKSSKGESSEETLHQMIEHNLAGIQGYDKPLEAHYVDLRALDTKAHGRELTRADRRDLRKLRENGCVVILDAISMRHPTLQRAYRRSLLDAFPKTGIVRIAPVRNALEVMPRMISFPETFANSEFYQRLSIEKDYGYCLDVSETMYFESWLGAQVKNLIPPNQATGARAYAFNERNR